MNPQLKEIRDKCQEAIDYVIELKDDTFYEGQIVAYQNVIDSIDEMEQGKLPTHAKRWDGL